MNKLTPHRANNLSKCKYEPKKITKTKMELVAQITIERIRNFIQYHNLPNQNNILDSF